MAEWLAEQLVPGFLDASRSPVDLRSFRAHGHHAARVLGGKFSDEPLPGICRSHDSALIVVRDVTTRVLLHHEIPLLAFAVHHPDSRGDCNYTFIDAPPLARAFGEVFVPAPKSVLDAPCDLLALERAVGKDPDIKYWSPRSVGEIFYNYWD